MYKLGDTIVICTACGSTAPYSPPDGRNPYGIFHWQQPCPACGANRWAAHDVNRDYKTGRLLDLNEKKKAEGKD